MEIKLETLMEGTSLVDSACMVEEANEYAEVLKDYFLEKAEHLTKAIAGNEESVSICQKKYKKENPEAEDVLKTLSALREVLKYIELKDQRFERAISLELEFSTRADSMDELEEAIRERHFELLGIGELLCLKSQTEGLFTPEFGELFERYGVK